jgi:hypothetical protein
VAGSQRIGCEKMPVEHFFCHTGKGRKIARRSRPSKMEISRMPLTDKVNKDKQLKKKSKRQEYFYKTNKTGRRIYMHLNRFLTIIWLLCLISGLSALPLYALGTITYIENFQNNANGWWTVDNDNDRGEISNNKFLRQKKTAQGGQIWSPVPVQIDQDRDFYIQCTLKCLAGPDNADFGLVYGLKPEKGFSPAHDFIISKTGRYRNSRWQDGRQTDFIPWTDASAINREGANVLAVLKAEGKTVLFINGQTVAERPFVPLFGNHIGIGLTGNTTVEVDNITIRTASSLVPDGWSVTSEGSFNNAITWQNLKNEKSLQAEVYNHGKVKAGKEYKGDKAIISVSLKTVNNPAGHSAGIFLQTEDGALIKMERFAASTGAKVTFSAISGNKKMGSKNIIMASNANPVYRLKRNGDVLKGEIVEGGKTIEVGSLIWPKLSANQHLGVIITYNNNISDAPVSFKCDFSELYVGKAN